MLHAIEKSKTRIPTRYLGDRDGIELRVSEEDEITSTVLGPLDFLTAAENHRFWQRLLASVKHANFLPPTQPSNVEFGFWERRIANDASGAIEPDAVVRMYWPDGSVRILLIELKWRAPLSGEDQLHRQWLQYLSEAERQTALHLFIAPNVSAGEWAQSSNDVWGESETRPSVMASYSVHPERILERNRSRRPLGSRCRPISRVCAYSKIPGLQHAIS
jgi:hypothetical protein